LGPWQLIVIELMDDYISFFQIFFIILILLFCIIKQARIKKMNIFISLCDPLVTGLIIAELTAAFVPIYMYIHGWMYRPEDFIFSYLTTEIALFLGVFLGSKGIFGKKDVFIVDKIDDNSIYVRKRLYIFYLLLFFAVRAFYFYSSGTFPLFSDQYYIFFFDSSPISTRISIDIYLIVCILWVDSFNYISNKKMNYFIGILIVITFILSAQKGLILYLFSAVFFIELYNLKIGKPPHNINTKFAIILLLGAVCIATLPMVVVNWNNDDYNSILAMAIRVIGNGDGFPLFYGLPKTSSILFENTGLFNFIWANIATFHFHFGYNMDEIPTTELRWIMSSTGDYVVPVIRHNLIAIKLFGIDYGWIYSFFLGISIGFVTRWLYRRMYHVGFLLFLVYCLIYNAIIETISNYQFVLRFETLLINVPIILLFYWVFYPKSCKRESKKEGSKK